MDGCYDPVAMFTDRMNFDTLDLVVASIAIVATLWLLPENPSYGTERFAVGLAVLAVVGAKRLVIPTLPANPDAHALVRMLYLFIAVVGTACVGIGLYVRFGDLYEFQGPAAMDPNIAARYPLGLGCTLLVLATILDRVWLKRRR